MGLHTNATFSELETQAYLSMCTPCIYISSHYTQGALHKRTAHQPIREYPLVSAPETPDLEDVSVLAMKPSFSSNQYQHLAMA